MAAFPTTAQEAIDRLLVDMPFVIQTIVNDNYQAVRERYLELLQDNPALVNTPEKLTNELVWWLRNDPNAVQQVLDVPWRNTLNSQVLNKAFVQMQAMVATTGNGGDKFLGNLIGAVLGLNGTSAQADAQAAAAAQAAAQAAAAETQRKAQQDKFIRIAASVLILMALVAFIIYLRRR